MKPEKARVYQIEIYRQMSGNQKLEIAFQLYEMACNLIRQSIHTENPELSSDKVEKLLAERMRKNDPARSL